MFDDSFSVDPLNNTELQERSSNLQEFLVGQLQIQDENVELAISSLERAFSKAGAEKNLISADLVWLYLMAGNVDKALEHSSLVIAENPTVGNLLRHAGLLEASDQIPQAQTIYEGIVARQDIVSPQAYFLLATSYMEHARTSEAIGLLKKLVEKKPDEIGSYYYLSRAYYLVGDRASAIRILKQATSRWPKNERLGLELARVMYMDNQQRAARLEFSRLYSMHPNSVLLKKLSELSHEGQVKSGDESLIIHLLSLLEQKDNSVVDLRYKTALVYVEGNNSDAAIQELLLVLAKRPSDSSARYYLGSVLAASGRKSLALSELGKIKADQTMFIESRLFASFIYRQNKDLSSAEKVLRSALEVPQRDLSVVLNLVDVLRELNRQSEALDLLATIIDQNPNSDSLLFLRAIVTHELGDRIAARQAMERVIEINPNHAQALNFVAYDIAEFGGDYSRARELIDRALAIQPDDGYFLDTLGWLYYRTDRAEQAVDILARAMNVVGEDVVVMEHYADALVAVGQVQRAREFYGEALRAGGKKNDPETSLAIERIKKKLSHFE